MRISEDFFKMYVVKAMIFILLVFACCRATSQIPSVSIVTDRTQGASALHGLAKLTEALKAKNITFEKSQSLAETRGKFIFVTGLSKGDGEAARMLMTGKHLVPEVSEALTIWKTKWQNKAVCIISGYDDTGLMYGLLDASRNIDLSPDTKDPMSDIIEITEKPDVKERAISLYTMNRTYWESRSYDEVYWTRYLDLLAQNRFNSMVVIFGYENGGFLAPCYPYFFDVESFPEVKMVGITPEEQEYNLRALNRLIEMAHSRGIRFTVGIWDHIYRGGVQGGGIPGTRDAPDQPVPGLVWGVNSDNLISYNKTALAKFVKLVPGLDAIQFRMHNESGLKKEEQVDFWSDVFNMMKETVPHLQLDLRAKELPEAVVQSALDIGIKFRITTKYWMEQMGMPYHPTQINPEKSPRRHSYADMLRYPKEYQMHYRLWNGGTSRILLWGDPEYVRRFAESTHLYDAYSYEVNEPLATKMEAQPHDNKPFDLLNPQYRYYDFEFERYWHFFQVFGRIGYNPDASSEIWHKEFELRFNRKAANFIETALHQASWILPRIVASCYPYSGFPMTRGWAEKQRLGNLDAYAKNEGSDIQQFANFDEEAQILIEGGGTAKILPSINSRWFKQTSSSINKLIVAAEKNVENNKSNEFISTITDLKILSGLALYHSCRIPAAVSYRLFVRTQDVHALDEAIAYERLAIDAWRQIVSAAGDVYTDDLMMGVRGADLCGHWKDELAALEKGLLVLEQRRNKFIPEGSVTKAPKYKVASERLKSEQIQVTHQRITQLQAGSPLNISVKASAPSGVKSVSLSYRSVNQDQEYQTIPLYSQVERGIYKATVPADQINGEYDFMYFIKVMDNDNNGIIYPDLNKETPYIIVNLIR